MYILSRKDVVLNGANPTILNGYGGFNIADLPYFSVSRLLFLKHFNGIYASANLRGGRCPRDFHRTEVNKKLAVD